MASASPVASCSQGLSRRVVPGFTNVCRAATQPPSLPLLPLAGSHFALQSTPRFRRQPWRNRGPVCSSQRDEGKGASESGSGASKDQASSEDTKGKHDSPVSPGESDRIETTSSAGFDLRASEGLRKEDGELETEEELLTKLQELMEAVASLEVDFYQLQDLFTTLVDTFYRYLAELARDTEFPQLSWIIDEDGVPLAEQVDGRLADTLTALSKNRGVDFSTVEAVHRTLLSPESASSPILVRAGGEVVDFIDCELDAGHIFFGELREGVEPAAAVAVLSSALKAKFPDLRAALLPFPAAAESIAEDLALDPSRRCTVVLFKKFNNLNVQALSYLLIPSVLLTVLQLKHVAVSDPAIATDPASVQAAALFAAAALLPAAAAFLGLVLLSAAHKKPLNFEFVPILTPGAGIATIVTRLVQVPSSRALSVDFALASSLAPLAASLAMIKSSSCAVPHLLPSLPSLETFRLDTVPATSLAVPGTVLVPQSILEHSVLLNMMADKLSCASLPDPRSNVDVLFAMPPLALAGLLGLHMTAVCLVPFANFNGGKLVEALVEDEALVMLSQLLALVFVIVCIVATGSPTWWVFLSSSVLTIITLRAGGVHPLRWDGMTPPGIFRSLLSTGLIGASIFLLLPKPLYDWLSQAGLEPSADTLLRLLLP